MQIVIQLLFSLSLLGFVINLILGYLMAGHGQWVVLHLVIGLGSVLDGVVATMLSTSYYQGIRDQLTEEGRIDKIPLDIIEQAKPIKKELFSTCGMAMILILIHAVIAGCVFVKIIPPLPHHVLAYLVIMSQARAFRATVRFHRFAGKLLEKRA